MIIINRNNFDNHWLEVDENKDFKKFRGIRLVEIENSRDLVKTHLITTIKDHYSKPARVEYYLENLDYSKLSAYISNRVPTNDKVRKGDFGEIIGSEHLEQKYGFDFPVLRLRYKTHSNISMPGEDILGFKLDNNEIKGLCVGEAKTYTKYDGKVVRDAHNRLKKAYKPYPASLSFISDILWDEKSTRKLADEIEELMGKLGKEEFPRDNWIFFITGNRPRDPFEQIKICSKAVQNLTVVSIHLPEMSIFVNELFDECRV